jgi:hypothetical protein
MSQRARSRFAISAAGFVALMMLVVIARADGGLFSSMSISNVGVATGGGTVTVDPANPSCNASFGVNSVRPSTFPSGQALGRLNYDKADGCSNAHVNVPITFKAIEATQATSNGTGGGAQMLGDCGATNSVCPPGFATVQVRIQDNSDSGAGSDMFMISFCTSSATQFPATGCGPEEGGPLATGNIQVRPPP